jgi:ataxin-3
MEEFIYWEHQDSDLMCAVHALNSLLQGPYFDPVSLAHLAQELDQREREIYGSSSLVISTQGGNVAESGFYNIQVITRALETHDLTLTSVTSEEERSRLDYSSEEGFICNRHEHWFGIRKLSGQWFDLNSLNPEPGPKYISDFYLDAFLMSVISEGYSIFVVRGSYPKYTLMFEDLEPHQFLVPKEVVLNERRNRAQEEPDELNQAIQQSLSHFSQQEEEELARAIEESMKSSIKLPDLVNEPTEAEGGFAIRARLPDGKTISRNFLPSHSLSQVLDWAKVATHSENVQLATSYPRQVLRNYEDSLEKAGFSKSYNVIMIEKSTQ